MRASALQAFGMLAGATPFLAIFALLTYFFLRRAIWKRKKRLGKVQLGVCPSAYALGTVLQLVTLFYQPQLECEIKASQVELVEEDDQEDPESPVENLDQQLKRIRGGEPLDGLIFRTSHPRDQTDVRRH
jgi:hypothetical protein